MCIISIFLLSFKKQESFITFEKSEGRGENQNWDILIELITIIKIYNDLFSTDKMLTSTSSIFS